MRAFLISAAALVLAGCATADDIAANKIQQELLIDLFASSPGEWIYNEGPLSGGLSLQVASIKNREGNVFMFVCTTASDGTSAMVIGLVNADNSQPVAFDDKKVTWRFDNDFPLEIKMSLAKMDSGNEGLVASGRNLDALRRWAARSDIETITAISKSVDMTFAPTVTVAVNRLGCR